LDYKLLLRYLILIGFKIKGFYGYDFFQAERKSLCFCHVSEWHADHPFIVQFIYQKLEISFSFLLNIISFIIVIVNLKYYQGEFRVVKKLKGPGTSPYQITIVDLACNVKSVFKLL